MLIRGSYYEGWKPTGKPLKERQKEKFLAHIKKPFSDDVRVDPERVARVVKRRPLRHPPRGSLSLMTLLTHAASCSSSLAAARLAAMTPP